MVCWLESGWSASCLPINQPPSYLFSQKCDSPLKRQRGMKKGPFLLRNVANNVYFQGSVTDPAGRDREMKMSWDELQLVPPTTSKLKFALQSLFSQKCDSPLKRQRGMKKGTFFLRIVANNVYFQGSVTDPSGRDREMKMSWDELQLVPPTTSKLKFALQSLFSQKCDSPLKRQRGMKKGPFFLRTVANNVYFHRSSIVQVRGLEKSSV